MSEYRDCKRELEVVEYVGKGERGEDIGGTLPPRPWLVRSPSTPTTVNNIQ